MKGVGKDLPLFVQPRGLKRFIFPAGKHFKLAQGVALCASPFAKISQSLNHVHRWQNPKWVPKILQLCNSANDTLKRLLTPWDTERRLAFVGAADCTLLAVLCDCSTAFCSMPMSVTTATGRFYGQQIAKIPLSFVLFLG